jgi:hypothetical protein
MVIASDISCNSVLELKFILVIDSAPGYGYYKDLREDFKKSCEDHFKELMNKLKAMKKRHMNELKLLAKYHKRSGRPLFQRSTSASSIGSFGRIRQMTASVAPSVNSHHNTALQSTSASSTGSFGRIRQMTSSVAPSMNSHHNIALQVFDLERDQEKQRSKDSQV